MPVGFEYNKDNIDRKIVKKTKVKSKETLISVKTFGITKSEDLKKYYERLFYRQAF